MTTYPNINQISIKNCEGLDDDEVNLLSSGQIHQRRMGIHRMDDDVIASGGTDLFLAGNTRTKGSNAKKAYMLGQPVSMRLQTLK